MNSFIIITVFIGIIGLLIWWNATLRAKRVTDLKEFAVRNDFIWSDRNKSLIEQYIHRFHFFRNGTDQRFIDFLQKQLEDSNTYIFQFTYVTGSGKSRTTHSQTICLMTSKKINLPYFYLEPENILYKIGEFFGKKDINFPDSHIFSSKYFLKGDDIERITSRFNQETRSFFEQNLGWSVEGNKDAFIVFRHGKVFSVVELKNLLSFGEKIKDLFKE
ncbi:MAG TPA: hypothetical protein VLX68_10280 [Chitinivibrionales bacterium]|nr:hypothetical protein [Chitinivibrionales bacterium]